MSARSVRRLLAGLVLLVAVCSWSGSARAHVGSPDVFLEGQAGPYTLFVTVRPPEVIPGVAEVQVRSAQAGLRSVRIAPLPLGSSTRFAPTPDEARTTPADLQLFSGHLWMMAAGSWEVRITVEGERGPGVMSVPVPALPRRTLGMQVTLGVVLAGLLLFLSAGLVSIAGAVVRESHLPAGELPGAPAVRRGRRTMLATAAALLLLLYGGARWWQAEARAYDANVYRPLPMQAKVQPLPGGGPGSELVLTVGFSEETRERRLERLALDHGHLVHLFVVRTPALDRVFHLHPTVRDGHFVHPLPPMEPGRYALYADLVHRNGLPETLTATLEVPVALEGRPLRGDDSSGSAAALSASRPAAAGERPASPLPGGGQMVLDLDPASLVARRPTHLRFRVEAEPGRPAGDLELYMGMLGHAAVLRDDGSVFAHLHPTGSVPMPALELVSGAGPSGSGHGGHAGHGAAPATLPSVVSFPYGFPSAGRYRLFVQVKRQGQVQTGVFDLQV